MARIGNMSAGGWGGGLGGADTHRVRAGGFFSICHNRLQLTPSNQCLNYASLRHNQSKSTDSWTILLHHLFVFYKCTWCISLKTSMVYGWVIRIFGSYDLLLHFPGWDKDLMHPHTCKNISSMLMPLLNHRESRVKNK